MEHYNIHEEVLRIVHNALRHTESAIIVRKSSDNRTPTCALSRTGLRKDFVLATGESY